MSLFSSSRCVLILADEGLQVFNVGRFRAKFIDFVPWDTVEFETSIRDLIVHECKRAPIIVLNDMVEQHYRKERIPNVGFMDRANVLKRRLGIAFPNYKIRAALKLDEKNDGLGKNKKGVSYLFAAITASEAFTKTMTAIQISNAPVIGFYLLPIEAATMVKALSAKISKANKTNAAWTIFMGQHQSGSVRQIVTRHGELALTRMTPIVDTDVEPALWAKEIAAELSATMSYLARFGYKDTDGLNVVVIGNETAQQAVHDSIHIDCNLQVLTSEEAGKLLGANVGAQADYRYADPLHAAYLGRKSKFRLPVHVPVLEKITKPKRVATFILLGLLAVAGYVGYSAFNVWAQGMQVDEEIRVAEELKKSVKQEYDLEVAKKKEIGFDFVLVSNSVELFDTVEAQKIKPLSVMSEIGRSLGTDLHLDKLTVEAVEEKPESSSNRDAYDNNGQEVKIDKKPVMEAVMTLSFDNDVAPDIGVEKVNTLKDKIQKRLPTYDVSIVKQVADLSYTGNFVGEASELDANGQEPENYEAEIVVRGPVR